MLATAKNHFNDDMDRARGLLVHARILPAGILRDDILRSAWMMGVGACDAYFSDAYADLIARVLRAKEMESSVVLPNRLNDLKLPVTAVLSQSKGGWRWRMAARELIEDESVLSLEKIRHLFNHFFRTNQRLPNKVSLEGWILHREARSRLFGITAAQYRALPNPQRTSARERAMEHLQEHFSGIFQRRHDCIHNCDRPKVALQPVSDVTVEKKLYDIEFLVSRCEEAFVLEFPEYLRICGFGAVTRNRVCQ